ncbi:hypothetical protein B9Z65_5400 [Elsinoe australis]|uniref:Uncharacterized protein n=1 Tax=Elsinoe australis TaxID=40998 RepID=A0A2P7ZDZ8_9PEZI|nr:hypothetical protein B9Z65_5400 [Elsinoe australis]
MYSPLFSLKALISLLVLFQLVSCLPSGRGTSAPSSNSGKRPASSSGPAPDPKKPNTAPSAPPPPPPPPAPIPMTKDPRDKTTYTSFKPHNPTFQPPMTDQQVTDRAKGQYQWLQDQNLPPNTYKDTASGQTKCTGQMVSSTFVPGVGCGSSTNPRGNANQINQKDAPVANAALKPSTDKPHAEDAANAVVEKNDKNGVITGPAYPPGSKSASWGHFPDDYEEKDGTFQLKKGPDGQPVPSHAYPPCQGVMDGSRKPSCTTVQGRLGIQSATPAGSQRSAQPPAGQGSAAPPPPPPPPPPPAPASG